MRFRLFDKMQKTQVHEGVMPRASAPAVVIWGARAFVRSAERTLAKTDGGHVVGDYVEVDAFQIGGFR